MKPHLWKVERRIDYTDNKDTLQYNRDLLFQCKSIERIITKFYETTI